MAGVLALLLFASLLLYAPRESATLEFDRSAYASQSISLVQGHGNTIRLGEEWLPGFYPPAYPASIVVVHWLLGTDSKNGVFASLAFAVVTLLLVYVLGRRVGGPAAGAVAVLLLAGNEMYGQTASSVLSQAFALSVVALTAVIGIGAGARDRAVRHGFAVGLVAGLSLLIRYQNFILPAALGIYALAATRGGWFDRVRGAVPLGLGVVLGGAVVMAYCAVEYGSPFRTGYHEWDFPFEKTFALRHFFYPEIIQEIPPREFFLVRCLLGLGPIYPWPIALLWIAGIAAAWKRRDRELALSRTSLLALFLNATLFVILGMYVFRSAIYAMLGLPLIMVMAAVGATILFRGRRAGAVPLWIVPLALAALSTLPAVQRSHLLGAGGDTPIQRGQSVVEAADRTLEDNAVLLGFCDPILADHVFVRETERRYLYLKRKDILPRIVAHVRAEMGGDELAAEAVGDYVASHLIDGRPLYFLLPVPGNDVDIDAALQLRKALGERFIFGKSELLEIETIKQ